MDLHDKELWLEKHGVMSVAIEGGMHRVRWTPTYGIYCWSRFADTYTDALDTLFNSVKSEIYYRANASDNEAFRGSR